MFFAYKKLLGRTEKRTHDRMCCQMIRTVRDISRDDQARIATYTVAWLAHLLRMQSFGVQSSDQACHILGAKTWLSTLETAYLLWGVVAQWLERRFKTWESSFAPHCLCL